MMIKPKVQSTGYLEDRVRDILREALQGAASIPMGHDDFKSVVEEHAYKRFGSRSDYSDDQIREIVLFTIRMCRVALPHGKT